jgi:hypothetical protein
MSMKNSNDTTRNQTCDLPACSTDSTNCATMCPQRKLLGIINVDFDATGQLMIIYAAFVKYLRKKQKRSSASALYRLHGSL